MSEKKKKPQKLKARLPRGFIDRSPADIRATDEMVAKIKSVYERYGFDPVETPIFEYTDCLGKFLPDQDRPNEGALSVQDDAEQGVCLPYDLTAPRARHELHKGDHVVVPPHTAHQVSGKDGAPCRFALTQGIGAYDFVPIGPRPD